MALFPGDEWFELFIERINSSVDYRSAASDWEGDCSFVIEAEPDKRVAEDVWLWLDLWHGECRGGGRVTTEIGDRAEFIIRAPYSRWKEILRGELDPIKGMMQGKLRLRGDLPKIVRYARAANALVSLTMTVPTEFVDEEGK